ncbi:MAG: tetratricopeptide repeat protein [Promethearchaeota archaeon]|jgi:tetratricopeptide (TPR) repeat protein
MSIPKYPPEGIITPMKINKDFEYIILWMLYNNDFCTWSDFKSKPVNISPATLSKYLNILISNGFIEKAKKGEYIITSEGRKQYTELQVKDSLETSLNYPPEVITKTREYDHWILWMLYNNAYCKWSDFLEPPLSINQSSLSKNLNLLLDKELVEKDNREYRITRDGETQYFKILKTYDLDRQSILNEESKRVEVITDKVGQFFDEYEIDDDEIRYRFLNMVLRLDYTKVESTLSDEVDFDKILLFLSINHPDNYPNHLTPQEFALKYNIKLTTLKFFVEKIVEDELYAIRFFKLNVDNKYTYYIQTEERLEKILSVIIEDYIRKFTYLSKFQTKNGDQTLPPDINKLLDDVVEDICKDLIHEDLKPSLRIFLVEYIEHLAYKFEKEKSLINHTDKIKGIAFQNVFEVIQNFGTSESASASHQPIDSESYYFLHNRILDTMDIIYLSKIDFFRLTEFKKAYFPKNTGFLSAMEEKISKGSLSKASELLTENLHNLSEIEMMILRDIIYTINGELEESVDLTNGIIEKYPDEYVGYLFQSATYFLMGKFKDALNVIELGLTNAYDVLLITQKVQILINYDHSKAVGTIDAIIEDYPDNFALLRTKFLTVMTDKECCIGPIAAPKALIDSLIESYPSNDELKILKGLLFIVNHKYQEAKNWIKESIKPDISENNPRIDIASYLIRTYSYLARGKFEKALKYVRIAQFHYPNHPLSHIMSGLVHGFNIIYKFDPEKENKELFIEGFRKGISMQQSGKKLSRYYQLECIILSETDGFEEAVKAIDKAIELSPEHFDIYSTKAHVYLTRTDIEEEVFKFFDELIERFPHEDKDIRKMKSFSHYSLGNIEAGIKILEESLEIYPDSIGMLNNLGVFLSYSGRFPEAIETIEKAIEIDPNEGNLYDTYGEILLLANDYKAAIEKFYQALELNPTGWFAFHSFLKLSKSYKALGMLEEARTCYEKAQILTEKVLPGKRKMYNEQLDEIIEDLGKVPLRK